MRIFGKMKAHNVLLRISRQSDPTVQAGEPMTVKGEGALSARAAPLGVRTPLGNTRPDRASDPLSSFHKYAWQRPPPRPSMGSVAPPLIACGRPARHGTPCAAPSVFRRRSCLPGFRRGRTGMRHGGPKPPATGRAACEKPSLRVAIVGRRVCRLCPGMAFLSPRCWNTSEIRSLKRHDRIGARLDACQMRRCHGQLSAHVEPRRGQFGLMKHRIIGAMGQRIA
jgi:hypothetical protein